MAVSADIVPIVSGYQTSKINENFVALQAALEETLGRYSTSPNQMEADIDMNGHTLLNLGNLDVDSITINGEELNTDELIAKGDPGEAATITLGTVTTGAAGTTVLITNTGDDQHATLNFTIPRGDTGSSGAGSGDMVAAQNLNDVVSKPTAFSNIKQDATDTATGVVELATDAETITGTDTVRAVTPANLTARLNAITGYRFAQRRVFTSNTSYTPTAGTDYIHVIMCGGGGGGGGADTSLGSEASVSATGGGSGAETIDFYLRYPTDFSAPISLTVGGGGSGGGSSGTDGSNGVDSSFGSIGVAKRGIGAAGLSGSSFTSSNGANRSSNGTLPSGGIRFHGSDGGSAIRGDGGTGSQLIQVTSGNGGDSYLGGGGRGQTLSSASSSAGRDGGNYGAGGGGAVAKSTGGAAGGDGANGIIIIEEYVSGL